MSIALFEPAVWVLMLGVFVGVMVLGLFNCLHAQSARQRRDHRSHSE